MDRAAMRTVGCPGQESKMIAEVGVGLIVEEEVGDKRLRNVPSCMQPLEKVGICSPMLSAAKRTHLT